MNELIPISLFEWNPFKDLSDIRDSLDRFFDQNLMAKNRNRRKVTSFIPAIEVINKKDSIVVKAEVPGIEKKDIQLAFDDGHLVLKGESKRDVETKEDDYYYSERMYGSFYRTIPLPSEVDQKNVKAQYRDGVLTVTLPRSKESKDSIKTIEIE